MEFDDDYQIRNSAFVEGDESEATMTPGLFVLHQHHVFNRTEHPEVTEQILETGESGREFKKISQ